MLNKSGITKNSYMNVRQILFDVDKQTSVGCVVPQSLGVAVGTSKIVKAGTPIKVDLNNLQADVVKANGSTAMNAVLLHDVDVTAGKANGTALIFGFVNVNRCDSDVQSLITTAAGATGVSPLIVFAKL
jgi:hypothetical protein|nr:MAG TPA: hypothetical protein [Caudoviricetes sp.]